MQATAATSAQPCAARSLVTKLQARGNIAARGGAVPGRRCVAAAASNSSEKTDTITGVVFRPFDEVAPVLASTSEIPSSGEASLARAHTFKSDAEAAINEQINIEYNMSYIYHSAACYFDRDTVSLPGFAEYFRRESLEERTHAQKLIDLQNTRGGRVRLNSIVMPEAEFDNHEKGDALFAMELALSLEKLNFDKLLHLWETCDSTSDPQLTHYIEDMLQDQVEDIKIVADYVSQLRRVGKGHGVWHFDQYLYDKEIRARAQPMANNRA